jgi:hypothetical protein
MALMLPLLLMILFAIIDLGYYVYGYATIYQAARNGSEKANELPPHESTINPLYTEDRCVKAVLDEVKKGAVQFPDIANFVQISYPNGRQLKQPVEINITYNIDPLTPLWRFVSFGNNGQMRVQTTSRRSIETLGVDPNKPNGVACEPRP